MHLRKSLATTLAVAFAVALATPTPALAADDTSTVSWSVRPSNADGPDGRAWIELDVDPGGEVTDHLTVINHGRHDVDFQLSAADGYFTDTGRFNMLPLDQESTDAGTWISLQDSVSVPAQSAVTVPFTISVPENATPGDHLAGVAASISSAQGGNVAVESRVGFRVLSRVSGELQPALAVQAQATYDWSLNPFEPGTAWVHYSISDTGNTRLAVAPTISISGPFGAFARSIPGEVINEIGPGETRTFRIEVPEVWPLGLLLVDVSADPHVVPVGDSVTQVAAVQSSALAAAIPWSQLVIVLVIVLLIWWWRHDRRRLRRDLDRQLAEAREQVLSEAETKANVGVRIIAAGMLAAGLLLASLTPAMADTGADGVEIGGNGIAITVDIQPIDQPAGPAQPAGPTAPPTASEIAATGANFDAGIVLAGGALSVLGVLFLVRRRRRSAPRER